MATTRTWIYLRGFLLACLLVSLTGIPADFSHMLQRKKDAGFNVFLSHGVEVDVLKLKDEAHKIDIHQVLSAQNGGANPQVAEVLAWLESDQYIPEKSLFVRFDIPPVF